MLNSMEEERKSNKEPLRIEYELAPFHRRVLANMIDIIIMFLLFVAIYIPTNAITKATSAYKHDEDLVNQYRLDSGLFLKNDSTKTYVMYPTYYDNYANDASWYVKMNKTSESIENFIVYVGKKLDANQQAVVQKDYDEYRLKFKYEGEPYFVLKDGKVVSNKYSEYDGSGTCKATNEMYYKEVYSIYAVQQCGGYLLTMFPEYKGAMQEMSNMLFFIELPIAYTLSAVLTFLVPPLIFRRGRKTLGKLLYRVGLIDKRLLSPSAGRYMGRFAILFFLELVLSFFTFGIPFILSFTLMAFSKRKQGFPDFAMSLIEIDTSKANIYFNKYEASVDQMQERKKGISFHMKSQV